MYEDRASNDLRACKRQGPTLKLTSFMSKVPKVSSPPQPFDLQTIARRTAPAPRTTANVEIAQALVTAAVLSFTNAAEDIICPNAMQNILVVSAPSGHNAKTYAGVEAISIGSAIHEGLRSKFTKRPTCLLTEVHPLRGSHPTADKSWAAGGVTRIVQLERENAALKGSIEQLRSEMAELRSARKCEASQPPQAPKPPRDETSIEVPVEAPSVARTAKKRALTKPVRDEGLEEFQTEMRVMLKSLSEVVAKLNAKVDVLDGKFNALEARAAANHDLTLVTDPAFPTRIGNSCSRDTTPDLTFVKNFRKSREERALIQDSSIDLERWATQLKGDVKSATKTVQTDLEIDRMDSRLAHLLEAKKALLGRFAAVTVNHNCSILNSASFKDSTPSRAEQAAI
ncbi:hypothetical protein HPB47_005356 [Ixodes persulcatus]|uniref:Uncharacterized protein n=1 Tax=Ixodes persulcatus TaxID=34615 RepID=A0AC60PD68_IXOPE|nr:hypothetical protein HPB47_005356 [Ixodes persulcatus]